MGAAAIRHLKTMVMCGYEARDALATAVGSIALDCLRSVMPAEEYEGRQHRSNRTCFKRVLKAYTQAAKELEIRKGLTHKYLNLPPVFLI